MNWNWEEQWKGDGNCLVCRRRKYCKTKCGAFKQQRTRMLRAFVRKNMSAAIFRGQEKTQIRDMLREAARETCTPYTEEALDAMCERLKQAAAHSPFTIEAVAERVASIVRESGMTLEDAGLKAEHEMKEVARKGVTGR